MEMILDLAGSYAPPSNSQPVRRIRKHTKSRRACANCRLRRVKCDEVKPGCQKCKSFGVLCSYDRGDPDGLQVLATGVLKSEKLQIHSPPSSESSMILNAINVPRNTPKSTSFGTLLDTVHLDPIDHFSLKDLELLKNWHSKTMPGLTLAQWKHVYENAYTKLTFSHPFLFHVVLTVTLMHERHQRPLSSKLELSMAYHWSRAACLMNHKLRHGLALDERDPLWACSGMLACLAFASFDATTPEETWPLAPPTPNDFDYMKFCCGKKVIWKLTDPLRKDSVFSPVATDFMKMHVAPTLDFQSQDSAMARLMQLCGIDSSSTADNNIYYGAVCVLVSLANMECNSKTMSKFLSFFGCMHSNFRLLLEQYDPCAMLILGFWYAKVSHSKQWWLQRRVNVQCQGICIYLTLHYPHDYRVLRLVQDIETVYSGHWQDEGVKQYHGYRGPCISVMQVLEGVPEFT